MQDSIYLNTCYKNQIYINLQNVLKTLKIFINKIEIGENGLENKTNRNKINPIFYYNNN